MVGLSSRDQVMSENLPDEAREKNVSSTYLSHIDGFSDEDPSVISLKYSMYMFANTGENGGHIGRNVVEIIIKMKTIARKPSMIKR